MRIVALFALASVAVGCTFYEVAPKRDEYVADRDDRCVANDDGNGAEDLAAKGVDESPPPAHPPREEGTFEVVARLVLESIPYKDCGAGGKGDIDITFMPNGAVQKLVIYADAWKESAKQCVSERFAIAHVAPFAGDARTVRWHAELGGDDGGWGS
jgi:hypothetical protein